MDETTRNLSVMLEIEKRLLQWRADHLVRNALLREAADAGISGGRIAMLTGLSRQSVWRILNGDPRALRQAPR